MVGLSTSRALAAATALLLGSASAAAVSDVAPRTKRQSSNSDDACAELGEAFERASRSLTDREASVSPSDAYACLRSIPVDAEADAGLIEYLIPFLEFQSTIGILADPPAGYMYPGVDIFGGLRNMTEMLENDEYDNQYDFAVDLYRLINVKPREGHLAYSPALINAVVFESPAIFVSVSSDGTSLPEVYLYDDYVQSESAGYDPSPVESFDGEPISEWLMQRSVDNDMCQDPDAAYNSQLWSTALSQLGQVRNANRFPAANLSDSSTLEFSNGTELTLENTALLRGNWTGIRTGDDVHQRFEVPQGRSGAPESNPLEDAGPAPIESDGEADDDDADELNPIPDLEGYPEPFIKHPDNYLTGYMFNSSSALSDVAVIAVKSFLSPDVETSSLEDFEGFVAVMNRFVRTHGNAGTERLIIDLQGNGGGSLANLIALYTVLFPEAPLRIPLRARHNGVLDWMGSASEATNTTMLPTFDIALQVDEELDEFPSWDEFYSDGAEVLGDDFTQLYHPESVEILENDPNQGPALHNSPFTPKETVIVTDGFCASACALAVGLMSRALNIRVVAMGGRPVEAPMQAIGGTKGGPVIPLANVKASFSEIAEEVDPPSDLDATPFASDAVPALAGPPDTWMRINSANVHVEDDSAGTPLQFVYEAANCRLFYTWDTLSDMEALWEAVHDVRWDGGSCVSGSTTNDDDTMAEDVPSFDQSYVSNYTWQAGPGDVSDAPPSGEPSTDGSDIRSGGGGGNGGTGDADEDDDNAAVMVGRSGGAILALVVSVAAGVVVF